MALSYLFLTIQLFSGNPPVYEFVDYGIGIALSVMVIYLVYKAWESERDRHDHLVGKYQELLQEVIKVRKDNTYAINRFAEAIEKLAEKEEKILKLLRQVERQQDDEQRER